MGLNKIVLALVAGMLLVEPTCAKSSFKGLLKSLSKGKQKQTEKDVPTPANSQVKPAAQSQNTFVDSRDGATYKFVKIGVNFVKF